jgi:transcriptional regulator with XRE-family HTH domain
MTALNKLLDLAKEKCQCATDAALAGRIHVSRAYLSSWRNGKDVMPDDRVVQLALLAGVDPADWLVLITTEQTTGATHRAWERVLQRLAIAAIFLTPLIASASPEKHGFFAPPEIQNDASTRLIMRSGIVSCLIRLRRWASDIFHAYRGQRAITFVWA